MNMTDESYTLIKELLEEDREGIKQDDRPQEDKKIAIEAVDKALEELEVIASF